MPNLSGLRRALAEAARETGEGALAGGGSGAFLGAGAGLIAGRDPIGDEETLEHVPAGALGGAALGALVGGASGGRRGLAALREALAERAAQRQFQARGFERMERNIADDDGVRRGFVDPRTNESTFGEFRAPPFRRLSDEEMQAAGYDTTPMPTAGSPEWEAAGPRAFNNRRANPMQQMEEMQAMRNALRQLQIDRRSAADAEELFDIDAQISTIMNHLNM